MEATFSERLARWVAIAYRHYIPVLVWMGVIFLLSSQPTLGTSTETLSLGQLLIRKGAHVFEYFVLGGLLFRLFRFYFPQNSHMTAAGIVLISLPYALSDEAHQLFVAGRQGRVTDVGIDAVGILLSLIFFLGILPWWRRRREG